MAPGLRYVSGEVTRGFFFFARLLHSWREPISLYRGASGMVAIEEDGSV